MVYGSLHSHKTNFSTSTWQVQRTIKSSSFNIRRTCLSAECGIIMIYRPDTAHFIAKICAESKKGWGGDNNTRLINRMYMVLSFRWPPSTLNKVYHGVPLLCRQAV